MRIVAFFVSLCFSLLSGGSQLHANTPYTYILHSSSSNLSIEKQDTFINANYTSITVVDADFDLDEEYTSNDNTKEGNSNKIFASKYFLLNGWYSTKAPQYILSCSDKFFKISQTLCGNSSPIYIKNRTLRI